MPPYAWSRKSDNRRREVRSGFDLGPAAAMTCRLPLRLRTRAAASDRDGGYGRTRGRAEARGQRARAPLFPFASNATSVSAKALSPRQESRSEIEWYFRNTDDEQVWRLDTRLRFLISHEIRERPVLHLRPVSRAALLYVERPSLPSFRLSDSHNSLSSLFEGSLPQPKSDVSDFGRTKV
jgi:hypothetical protein